MAKSLHLWIAAAVILDQERMDANACLTKVSDRLATYVGGM